MFVCSQLLAVDITVYHNGFHGDLNETFFVGEVEEGAKKLVQTTYECLMQAIDSGRNSRLLILHIIGLLVDSINTTILQTYR